MNFAHLHLIVNHVPVLGTAFGLGLLIFAQWKGLAEVKKAALGVFVIMALLAVPAYLTGEPAEGVVTSLPGVSKDLIEAHEEAATVAFAGVVVLGLGALTGLIVFRGPRLVPGWFGSLMLAASLVVSGLMAWTANLGGQVRHPEVRASASAPGSATAQAGQR